MYSSIPETSSASASKAAAAATASLSIASDTASLASSLISITKPKLTFKNSVKFWEIPHVRDFSPESKRRIWYQPDEYKQIKKENNDITESILNGTLHTGIVDDDEHSSLSCRGLEYRLPELYEKRVNAKCHAWFAVFDEQQYQWNSNIVDAEFLAKCYREATAQSQQQAYLLGLKDEAVAKQIHAQQKRRRRRRASLSSTTQENITDEQSSHRRRRRRHHHQRRVTFHKKIQVIHVDHIDDLTEQERNVQWYPASDFKQVRKQCKEIIREYLKSQQQDEQESLSFDLRGFEFMLPSQAKQRQYGKTLAISAVLDEQHIQDQEGFYDPESLSRIYKLHTLKFVETAIEKGKSDALAIVEYMQDNAQKMVTTTPKTPTKLMRLNLNENSIKHASPSSSMITSPTPTTNSSSSSSSSSNISSSTNNSSNGGTPTTQTTPGGRKNRGHALLTQSAGLISRQE